METVSDSIVSEIGEGVYRHNVTPGQIESHNSEPNKTDSAHAIGYMMDIPCSF